jgi:hypothetical protein
VDPAFPPLQPEELNTITLTAYRGTRDSEMSRDDGISVAIEFTFGARLDQLSTLLTLCSGGLEILFGNQKKHSITLPAKDESGAPSNIAFLVRHLCNKVMKDPRKELFVLDDTV